MSLFILYLYWTTEMLASGQPGQMGTTRVWETTMQEVHVFSGITGSTRRFRLYAGPSLYLQMCFKQTGSNWSPTGGNQIRLCRLVFRGRIIIFDFFFSHSCGDALHFHEVLSRWCSALTFFLSVSFFFFTTRLRWSWGTMAAFSEIL